jgi:hypothetical protein
MRERGAKTGAAAPQGPESTDNWELLMHKEGQNDSAVRTLLAAAQEALHRDNQNK